MTLLKIGNIKIKIDISMVILSGLWIFSGNSLTLFTMLFAVMIHECAHILCAKAFGLNTESITLYLFGGCAEIKGIKDSYITEGIIALFGPLTSVFTGFLWQIGAQMHIIPVWQEFVDYSYCIALINLIPIYPLDGGRILSSVLNGIFGFNTGKKILNVISVTFSTLYLLKNIVNLIFFNTASGIVMAIFMFIASLKSLKNKSKPFLRENKWHKAENIKIIKAYETESLLSISKKIFGNEFYVIMIFNKNEDLIGYLTEKQLSDELLSDSTKILKQAFIHQVHEGHL